jgi:hypothetical protein
MKIMQWLKMCSSILPVLEEGTIRQEVEVRAKTQRVEGHLSGATSLALRRLEDSGLITLEKLSDADVLVLDLGKAQSPVSHIRYNQG